jgi:hypothetical protein
MFRFVIAALAVVGLVSLFSGGVSGAATGFGFLFLLPLLLFAKVFFFMMLFGVIGSGVARRRGAPWGAWERPQRPGGRRSRGDEGTSSREDDFESWHRMAHAKEEVASWTENVD